MTKEYIKEVPNWEKDYLSLEPQISKRQRELLEGAKSELLEGYKLNPYNPYYMGYLGQILVIQGDYDQALSLIKEAARFNRTHHIKSLGLRAEQLRKLDHTLKVDKN